MAGCSRPVEDVRPRIGRAKPLAAVDRPRSASSARGRPRTRDQWPSPRADEILVQLDAQPPPARAPRYHCPRQSFASVVTPRTMSATRARALRFAVRAADDHANDWANIEAR